MSWQTELKTRLDVLAACRPGGVGGDIEAGLGSPVSGRDRDDRKDAFKFTESQDKEAERREVMRLSYASEVELRIADFMEQTASNDEIFSGNKSVSEDIISSVPPTLRFEPHKTAPALKVPAGDDKRYWWHKVKCPAGTLPSPTSTPHSSPNTPISPKSIVSLALAQVSPPKRSGAYFFDKLLLSENEDRTLNRQRISQNFRSTLASLDSKRDSLRYWKVPDQLHFSFIDRIVEVWRQQEPSLRRRRLKFDRLKEIMESRIFALATFCIIFANCVVMGLVSNSTVQESVEIYRARQGGADIAVSRSDSVLTWETCFACIFLVEVLLRLVAQEADFFLGPDCAWNGFDSIIVGFAMADSVVPVFALGGATTSMRVLKIIRSLRTLRLLRIAPWMYKLRFMILACVHSISALFWACAIFAVIIFMFAIVFMDAVGEYLDTAAVNDSNAETIVTFFDSLPKTMLSLFMSFTGGVDWWKLQEMFLDISILYGLLFFIFIIFSLISVMNVVMSIFVSDSMEFARADSEIRNRWELQESRRRWQMLSNIFEDMDVNKIGRLSFDDFKTQMEREEVRSLFSYLEMDVTDVSAFFRLLDVDRTESLDVEEFVIGCLRLCGISNKIDMDISMQEVKLMTRGILSTIQEHESKFLDKLCTIDSKLTKVRTGLKETMFV